MCCAVIIINDDIHKLSLYEIELMISTSRAADTLKERAVCRLDRFSSQDGDNGTTVFGHVRFENR